MTFHEHSVWFLLLLLAVPVWGWSLYRNRRSGAITFSSTAIIDQMRPTLRERLRWILPVLKLVAVVLLIVALARPQLGRRQSAVEAEGIAIEMVVDRSGSMQALDFQLRGQPVDRLTAIKDVAGNFITGSSALDGRLSDLVGLITFAGYADAVSPPTLDHDFLIRHLDHTQIVNDRTEDGTAIGDAIALAVEKLDSLDDDSQSKVHSKVAILLTDGENNAGEIDPLQAAELAQTTGVKFYTIGVGTKGQAPVPVTDPFTGRKVIQMAEVNIDEETLKKVAETTGGRYFRATNTQSLAAIYEEIDQLEKTELEEKNFVEYRELAIEPVYAGFVWVPPLVLLALLLFGVERVLQNTFFRQVP